MYVLWRSKWEIRKARLRNALLEVVPDVETMQRMQTGYFSLFCWVEVELDDENLSLFFVVAKIIEIAVQNEHLLTECQHKTRYKKCSRCTEAVNVNNPIENEYHFKNKHCVPFDKRMNRCPLCHSNVALGEEAWREHLMSPAGCPKNLRRRSSIRHAAVTAAEQYKKSTSSVHSKK